MTKRRAPSISIDFRLSNGAEVQHVYIHAHSLRGGRPDTDWWRVHTFREPGIAIREDRVLGDFDKVRAKVAEHLRAYADILEPRS